MLYTFNLQSAGCEVYPNKAGGVGRAVYRKNAVASGCEVSSHLNSFYKDLLTGLPDSASGLSISFQYCSWNKALKA